MLRGSIWEEQTIKVFIENNIKMAMITAIIMIVSFIEYSVPRAHCYRRQCSQWCYCLLFTDKKLRRRECRELSKCAFEPGRMSAGTRTQTHVFPQVTPVPCCLQLRAVISDQAV